MKWASNIQMGRITYQLQLHRDKGNLPEEYAELPFNPIVPLDQMVAFAYADHNDEFVLQKCTDPLNTVTNHRDGLVVMTEARIDLQHLIRDNALVTLDNINIQRQAGVPEMGLTYNIDNGGMIDEYLVIARRPLVDTNLPPSGIPKPVAGLWGERITGWTESDMTDIVLCEKRRYQPDARFVARQPLESASTYGDLGDPAIDPQGATTLRYPSLTLADVESWGDTSLPIQGPTLYVYRYFEIFAADRSAQKLGTAPLGGQFATFAGENFTYNQMRLDLRFPAVRVTMEGDKKDANIGELALAYQKDLLQRRSLNFDDLPNPREREPPVHRPGAGQPEENESPEE